MTPDNLETQIAKLLGADPICGGRVGQETVEAIAALSNKDDEVTEAMINAGVAAQREWYDDALDGSPFTAIYLAMRKAIAQ